MVSTQEQGKLVNQLISLPLYHYSNEYKLYNIPLDIWQYGKQLNIHFDTWLHLTIFKKYKTKRLQLELEPWQGTELEWGNHEHNLSR